MATPAIFHCKDGNPTFIKGEFLTELLLEPKQTMFKISDFDT